LDLAGLGDQWLLIMKNMKFKKTGVDVRISELAHIARPELVSIGNHIAIDMWTYISTQLILGDYIHIAPSVSIIGGAPALLKWVISPISDPAAALCVRLMILVKG
jgi:hypothetical protein